jgi:hypothetical protein
MSTWSDFLSTLAQVSVSLLALLFVSFQITRNRWTKKPARQLVAIQTSLEFLTPSFFAFVALLPAEPITIYGQQINVWQMGAIFTSTIGILISLALLRYGFVHPNQKKSDNFLRSQINLQPMALLEYAAIFWFSYSGNLVLTSAMMIWLLVSGSYETWLFFSEHTT